MEIRPILPILIALHTSCVVANDNQMNLREALVHAIKSDKAVVEFELNDSVAEMIRSGISRPGARIHVIITTIQKLPQNGCRRMKINISTPGTYLVAADGKSHVLDMSSTLNICENGNPPGLMESE